MSRRRGPRRAGRTNGPWTAAGAAGLAACPGSATEASRVVVRAVGLFDGMRQQSASRSSKAPPIVQPEVLDVGDKGPTVGQAVVEPERGAVSRAELGEEVRHVGADLGNHQLAALVARRAARLANQSCCSHERSQNTSLLAFLGGALVESLKERRGDCNHKRVFVGNIQQNSGGRTAASHPTQLQYLVGLLGGIVGCA